MQNEQQHIDDFTRKIIKDASLEQPSFDFTAAVMAEVYASAKSTAIPYEPLISKKTWLLLGLTFVVVTALVVLYGNGASPSFNLKQLMPTFKLNISPVYTYSICSLTLFFLLAIPYLKKLLESPSITKHQSLIINH